MLRKFNVALITSGLILAMMSFIWMSKFSSLPPINKMKGVCWVAGDSIVSFNLDSLVKNQVQWISQTPFAWMRGHNNPEISFDNSRSWWGERDEGLIHTTTIAHERGIKVMLKPHIWIRNANGKWRSDIEMKSKDEWEKWFCDYEEMILHYASVAKKGNMDALCIGTELLIPSTRFKERWIDIIGKIRSIYSGQLTYAANFYKEYDRIEFWGHLDYIGLQAYFPLTGKENPRPKELKKGWEKHAKKLKKVANKFNKKIIFTEVGYKNTSDAAVEPWLWPRQLDVEKIKESEQVQADCYEAMFETLWSEDWFGGLFIWKWFHGNHQYSYGEYQERMKERRKKRAAERQRPLIPAIEFSPQGKLAEKVMQYYFINY
jgi:hypothetical protein